MVFHPSSEVRWLGYWLTPTMETSSHFSRRLALAWASFGLVKRLSPAGKGMSPWCNRKLAVGLLFPILSFGGDLFSPNATMQRKLNSFWHAVLRWITNCFRSTPSPVLYCEASLPPLAALLQHKRRLAAVRLLCSPTQVNPAAARLHPLVPTWSSWRTRSSRHLLSPLHGSARPPKWSSAPSGGRCHLQLDAIAYSIKSLVPVKLPLAFRHLILPIPYSQVDGPSYQGLRSAVNLLLMSDWRDSTPPPLYYAYGPSQVPHAFMGLPRFTAGRLHQMRSGKSYLAAHPSWSTPDLSPLCPCCEDEDETCEHTILHCPAKAQLRETHLQGISQLGPTAPVWSSVPLLLELAAYISASSTGFPPRMPAAQVAWPPSP